MFCNKCSEEIPDGSLFCPKCGQKVETGEVNDRVQKGKEILANWGAVHTLEDYELALEAMGYHSGGDNCVLGFKSLPYEVYILNERENDLVVIPCDTMNCKPKFEWAKIIPKSEISSVKIKGTLNYTIIISRNGQVFLSVKVSGAVKDRQKEMLKNFVSHYQNAGIEKLDNKMLGTSRIIIAWIVIILLVVLCLFVGISMIAEGDKKGILMLLILFGTIAYFVYLKIKIKEKGE